MFCTNQGLVSAPRSMLALMFVLTANILEVQVAVRQTVNPLSQTDHGKDKPSRERARPVCTLCMELTSQPGLAVMKV
jgi:hypothetical protein